MPMGGIRRPGSWPTRSPTCSPPGRPRAPTSTSGWMGTSAIASSPPPPSGGAQERQLQGAVFSGDRRGARSTAPPTCRASSRSPSPSRATTPSTCSPRTSAWCCSPIPPGRPKGCNVYVGGGMGRTHNKEETFARIADPLGYVEAEHMLDLVQAIAALQRDHGNRQQRRLARMKYLIHTTASTGSAPNWRATSPIRSVACGPNPSPNCSDYLGLAPPGPAGALVRGSAPALRSPGG